MISELRDGGGQFALEFFAGRGVGEQAERFLGERLGRGVGLEKFAGDFAAREDIGHADEGDFDELFADDPGEGGDFINDAQRQAEKRRLQRGSAAAHDARGGALHQLVRAAHGDVAEVRAADPAVKVLVHPEVPFDVVQAADLVGSTEYIIEQVRQAPAGTSWAIGTEIHLVHRLALEHPDQNIRSLQKNVCPCATMNRIDPAHLLWSLENLADGHVVNRVTVADDVKRDARVALDRMLALKAGTVADPAAHLKD